MSVGRKPVKPSARELFPVLRARLLASRPVTTSRVAYRDDAGKKRFRTVTTYGKPTFRNVIEGGEHV